MWLGWIALYPVHSVLKIARDGDTARDKAVRIRLLVENERRRKVRGGNPFQVIVCIAARGANQSLL
jgi:hypothetical protein